MKLRLKILLFFSCLSILCLAVSAQDTGGVKGKVRSTRNEGIENASITARREGKDVKTVTTDAKGEFVMDGLPVGEYNFVFTGSGYATGIKYSVEVKKNKIRDLGDRLILAVDQGTQVIIRGVVFDEEGRSVRGANIDIEKKQADGSYKKVAATTSSFGIEPLATGEFVFRFPESGETEYRITATSKDVSVSKEINVNTAAVYRLALTLNIKE